MNLENKMPVVVFDTNVLVSAIQFDKFPLDLLDLAIDRHVQLVLSEVILSELYRGCSLVVVLMVETKPKAC